MQKTASLNFCTPEGRRKKSLRLIFALRKADAKNRLAYFFHSGRQMQKTASLIFFTPEGRRKKPLRLIFALR
ncbi:MAG: hypothetical protein B6245_01125 [Desulfobacteraceae bacterium 4572_88]|nr:MAG: hypothetical protein B6245_01125 [Desulfobacteraceae bacterium 4572_88]